MRHKVNIFQFMMVLLTIGVLVTGSNTSAMAQGSARGVSGDDGSNNLSAEVISNAAVQWGTADLISLSVNPFAFQGINNLNDSYLQAVTLSRYCDSNCDLLAPINLPTGAVIVGWVLDAYDNGAGNVQLVLGNCPAGTDYCYALGSVVSTSGDLGYTVVFSQPIAHTVDNVNNTYLLEAVLNAGSDYRIIGARVAYQLQVSPAPPTATFNDVPTSHPLFQYIEALSASGITEGYADGTFRPSQYVTRGQMAAFFSRALGLHWPN